jgi:hypothetical protein
MAYLSAAEVRQIAKGPAGNSSATLLVTWTHGNQIPDLVEIYWRPTSQTQPGNLADSVDTQFASRPESEITVRAPDQIEVTIYPRMTDSNGVVENYQPDDFGIQLPFERFRVVHVIPTAAEQPTGPPVPILAIVARHPKTKTGENRITISWVSNNYTDGNIYWGAVGQGAPFRHSIKPSTSVYHGQFTTDRPLIPAVEYWFRVQVKNSFEGNTWVENDINTHALSNVRSLREFLLASSLPTEGSVLKALGRGSVRLRDVMGL